jgi:hypothetical protein
MKPFTATNFYALAFGLFLGLCIWKFGNPVILDHKISAPSNLTELIDFAWPIQWANWILAPLAGWGAILAFQRKTIWPQSKWLWLLPISWLGWQFLSATQTVDAALTNVTLWQFSGCVAGYLLGATLFGNQTQRNLLFIGLTIAFIFCLIRAVDQHLFEFPANHQVLVEGERSGWTNFPPETIAEMKSQSIIITTNGADVANPVFLKKFEKGRVAGTMVYPNALAGLILLLFPAVLVLVLKTTKNLKCPIRFAAIALALFLGLGAFFWTGSKLGWLISLPIVGFFLLRLDWPKRLKVMTVATVLVLGLSIFAIRFHNYFSNGATSVGARFDYWQAATQTALEKPIFGTGPGTFQRPYAQLKPADAEMARLTHNDFLEQFSDSGFFGGIIYASWIVFALLAAWKRWLKHKNTLTLAIFSGVLAWFLQGFGEFSLYIPATAWITFTLLGSLVGAEMIEFDKKSNSR